MSRLKITLFAGQLDNIYYPLTEALYKNSDVDFRFVDLDFISKKASIKSFRNDLLPHRIPYLVKLDDSNFSEIYSMSLDSDVAIYIGTNRIFYKERVKKNKLTFFFHERIFKNGFNDIFNIRYLIIQLYSHRILTNKSVYMFGKGYYSIFDFKLICAYRNRLLRWGYFSNYPDMNFSEISTFKKINKKIRILWTGRLISLKHPEVLIDLAKNLINLQYDFIIDVIGDGPLFINLRDEIDKSNLHRHIVLHGVCGSEYVANLMLISNVFLFTSDSKEGWGFVLNEAMSFGCAVIANYYAGATRTLIADGKNGLIYKSNKGHEILNKVLILFENTELMIRLGKNAHYTIENFWNADIASDLIVENSNYLLKNKKSKKPISIKEILVEKNAVF